MPQGYPRVAPEQPQGDPGDGPGAALGEHLGELRDALAETGHRLGRAERELAASRREVELLREALAGQDGRYREHVAELRAALAAGEAERERLHVLLRAALDRPSFLERIVRAWRNSGPK